MAREMAMQMLFQSELGGTPLPLVVGSFDPVEYLNQLQREVAEPDDPPVAPEPAAPAKPPAASRSAGRRAARAALLEPDESLKDAFDYARTLVQGVHVHLKEIDARIRGQADNWRLERMPPVDRNILRLAVYELEHESDVPKLVVLDEAVELAKRYGSEQSGRFVNGLLDGILKRGDFAGSRE
jgi:transcription antitermination factor NusB